MPEDTKYQLLGPSEALNAEAPDPSPEDYLASEGWEPPHGMDPAELQLEREIEHEL